MELQNHLKTILRNKYRHLEDIIPIRLCHETADDDDDDDDDWSPDYDAHYSRHIDFSHLENVKEKASFPLEYLLKCDCNHGSSQKTIVTYGACGIGKTTAVQRCALDWAEGRAHQHIDLLFPLECWEINLLHEQQFSLIQVLQMFYPDLKELGASIQSSKNVWFVLDELEDFIEFFDLNCPNISNVAQVTRVFNLFANLIKGNLLPNAHIWITTRYAAVDFIDEAYILKGTEMRGFNDEQKELHIKNVIGDEHLANRVTDHIKMSRSLYYLCQIPYMCTAMATVLKKHVKADGYEIRPMTLTQIYSSLTEDSKSSIFPKLKECGILKVTNLDDNFCWMVEDLIEGIQFPVAEVFAFAQECPLVLRAEKSVQGVNVFRFSHLSVLEYFVALTILEEEIAEKALGQSLERFQKDLDVYRVYMDGQYDICFRFLFGLLKERGVIQPSNPFFTNVKKKFLNEHFTNTGVMLLHCLMEFDSQIVLDDVMRKVLRPSPPDDVVEGWHILLMIINMEGICEKFELELSSRCDEKVLRSLPALLKSTKAVLRFSDLTDTCCPALASVLRTKESYLTVLDLGFNNITDRGVKSLVQGLKEQDCRLKSLSLQACELTPLACKHLATALKRSPQLIELDLSCNDIGNVGLRHLASGLRSRKCHLETLRLSQCSIKKEGGFHLASALQKNPNHLKWLDLSINQIGSKAANELFTKFDISRLTKLEMYYCGLTPRCCAKISDALKCEQSNLTELNLSSNDLLDAGVQLISVGLLASSRLEKLNLSRCGMADMGCFYLAKLMSCMSAMYTSDLHLLIDWQATKLRELNLSMNKITDCGAIHISTGFKNPYSHLRKLNLSECRFTSECCSDLAAQLASKDCLLTELNLSSNCIQNTGVKKLCVALRSCECGLQTLILRDCGLSSKSVSFLNTALKTNQCLKELFVLGNKLNDHAIKVLVRMTKDDAYKLQTVDVSVD